MKSRPHARLIYRFHSTAAVQKRLKCEKDLLNPAEAAAQFSLITVICSLFAHRAKQQQSASCAAGVRRERRMRCGGVSLGFFAMQLIIIQRSSDVWWTAAGGDGRGSHRRECRSRLSRSIKHETSIRTFADLHLCAMSEPPCPVQISFCWKCKLFNLWQIRCRIVNFCFVLLKLCLKCADHWMTREKYAKKTKQLEEKEGGWCHQSRRVGVEPFLLFYI